MRVCLASLYGEGLYFSHLFAREGHESSAIIKEERYQEALGGLVNVMPAVGVYEASTYDLVCFDTTGMGKEADQAIEETPTIGDSSLADTLEEDRLFALNFMQQCGVKLSDWEAFDDLSDAIRFVRKTGKRYVFKPVGEQSDKSTTYVSRSAEDLLRYFDVLARSAKVKQFVLQEFVEGIEVSTEVYINKNGYCALNHCLEVKKFLNSDLGPNTGCSGSLVWMTKNEDVIFSKALKKCIEPLSEMGYVGPMDLNCIVNPTGVYGLEFCARWGYDAEALLAKLLPIKFSDFLYAVAAGETVPDLTPKHPFCGSVRLSVPPYPTDMLPSKFYREGIPIEGLREKDLDHWFVYDVRRRGESDDLETAGLCGWIGSPIFCGDSIGTSFDSVYDELKRVRVPNGQYRTDICDNVSRRYWQLRENGFLR